MVEDHLLADSVVIVRFGIASADQQAIMIVAGRAAILVSPFGYSTYRGS